jgi:hypothetical protein
MGQVTMTEAFRTHGAAAGKYPQRKPARPRSKPVSSSRVDRRVWHTALDLAQDDRRLIRIVSRITVVVGDSRYRH